MTLILSGTNGITSVNGSAAAPSVTGTDTDTGIVYGTNTITLATGGTAGLIQDASQNVALAGATPSAWKSNYKAFQVGGVGNLVGRSDSNTVYLSTNWYVNSSNQDIYKSDGAAAIYSQNTLAQHVFYSAASGSAGGTAAFTQILTAEKDKSLALQGASPQTGTGITFPATQSASTDANTLDDYEEGTWTPAWAGTTSDPTATYSSRTGSYVKIGSMVYCRFTIVTTSFGGGSGGLQISGLPFTPSGVGWSGVVGWNAMGSFSNNQNMVNIQAQPSSTRLYTHYINSTGATFDIVIGTGSGNGMIVEASIAYQV